MNLTPKAAIYAAIDWSIYHNPEHKERLIKMREMVADQMNIEDLRCAKAYLRYRTCLELDL